MGTPATKPKSLSRELTVALVVSITLVAALFGTLTFLYYQSNQARQFEEDAARYEADLQNLLEPALWTMDDDMVMRIGVALTTTGNFSSLSIRDDQQRTLYQYDASGSKTGMREISILHENAAIGSVEYLLDPRLDDEDLRRTLFTTIGFALLLMALLFLSLRWAMNKVLRQPLKALTSAILDVVEGKYLRLPSANVHEELSPIADSINTMSMAVAEREKRLLASEARYRELVQGIHVALVVHAADTSIVDFNREALDLLGLTEAQLLGRSAFHPDWMFLDENGHPLLPELYPVNRVINSNHALRNMICGIVRPERSDTVWVMVNGTPVRDEQGNLLQVRISFIDITERKQMQDELARYKDHLEEEVQLRTSELLLARDAAETANRAKSVFLASMSHELRTPLNAILGFSNLMLRESGRREVQRAHLEIINRSGEHLLTLINDVLEMAKIEAGKVQLEKAPLDLGALVREVTDMMQIRAEGKGLRLLLDQSSSFPRFINGDEARLRQILLNLLSNAVKFTEQGGVTLRLGSRINGGQHLIIEVEDSGPGISVEDQKRLFQPFVQLGKHPGDNKGTGLGLTITRQFVQLMGGTISIESTPGKGSTFRVDLPVEMAAAKDVENTPSTAASNVIGLVSGQPEYRILIVEDQEENQLLLRNLLDRVGLRPEVADDGKQAVEMFQSWQPHLILMDRRMPVMDGIEATKAIRSLPGGKEVKIVAVTASAFKEQADEMFQAGMDDFVRKPYRFNEIYDCLTRQLGVQYRYAETQTATAAPVIALSAEMLAILPQALHSELKAALESLNSERISTVLEQIKSCDEGLHQTLSKLVENYDYPAILKVLQINE